MPIAYGLELVLAVAVGLGLVRYAAQGVGLPLDLTSRLGLLNAVDPGDLEVRRTVFKAGIHC